MAFHYLTGSTTPGAPDEVVDWFATFELWITATVGWIIANGAGTTDLTIRSTGEIGTLTMLYVHLWQGAGANADRVYVEVSEDAVPTHETAEGGFVESDFAQFVYFMAADKDSIAVVWKRGAGYRFVYGGLVMPFALNPVDETYYSIAASTIEDASILRRFDNVWDQDDFLFENSYILGARRDRDDGSLPIGGVYFADHADTAGQLKHVTCEITDPATNPEDTLTTGWAGADTTWIVLQDSALNKFAMRTGGVLATGRPDGNFAHANANAGTIAAWFLALRAFLTGRGWSENDISGASGVPVDWEFHSAGEDGTDDIWIRFSWVGLFAAVSFHIADSAFGTPGRHDCPIPAAFDDTAFPTFYYFSGDRDCLCFTVDTGAMYRFNWVGRFSVFAQNLSSIYMRYGLMTSTSGFLLLSRTGNWGPGGLDTTVLTNFLPDEGWHGQNSQPNLYDATTYMVWPFLAAVDRGGGVYEVIGQMKYGYKSHGGGIAIMDTITVGARVYTVMWQGGANFWAMRTV